MKALILAGGKGTRLRPLTYSMAKQLVPVANRPVIEYGIAAIAEAGIQEVGVIVTESNGPIEAACGNGARWGVRFTYIPQPDPLGLAHAVKTAREFLGDDDFVMYLGDNLIKSSVAGLVQEFQRNRPAATVLLTPVPNPSDFGVAEMEGDRVVRLQEKPKEPKSNLALVGVYLFDRRIHDSIDRLKPSGRGEYEITDAIQGLIDARLDVRSHIVEGWWKDTGTVDAILEANRLILQDLEPDIRGEVDSASRIEGRVVVADGAKIIGSVIRGPAIVGANCHIERSEIGPFTSIDAGTRVIDSNIEDSIVLQNCAIESVGAKIRDSLIGQNAKIGVSGSGNRALKLVLGDSSEVLTP